MTEEEKSRDQILNKLFGLMDAQNSLNEVFQAIADGITVQDTTGTVLFVNDAAAKLMGFPDSRSFMDGDPDLVMQKFDLLDATRNPFPLSMLPGRQILRGAENAKAIIGWRDRETGIERWSEIQARGIKDREGKIKFAVNVFRDITDQLRITEEYQRSARRNTHILESITDGFFSLDRNWNFNYVNKQAEILFRRPKEDLLGKNIFEIFPNIIQTQTYIQIKEALNRGESMRYEEFFPQTGQWIESSAYPAHDGVSVYLRDITAQKLSEEVNSKLAAIVESSDDAIVGKSLDGTITSWNKGAENIYGYKAGEIVGKNVSILIPTRENNDVPEIMEKVLNGDNVEHHHSRRLRKDGQIIDISVTYSPIKNKMGTIIGISSVARDITKHMEAAEAIQRSEDRFRAMIENSSDGIALINPEGKIIFTTSTVKRILGYDEEELLGRGAFDFVHPEDLEKVVTLFGKLLEAPGNIQSSHLRALHKNGTYRWIEAVGTNLLHHANIHALVANFRDVTERKRVEDTLQYQYHHDALTDLPNRTYLSEALNQMLAESDLQRKCSALLMIDLDRFKHVNESLGHAVGDRLIQEVALRLRSCVPEPCTLTRLGGDEFGILMPNIETEEEAAKLASKFLEEFKTPFYLDKHEIFISPSIGISMYPYDGKEGAAIVKNAEAALYRAKERGRNTYQFYTTTMNSAAYERLTMESKLRHAIENNEFVLFYQPQISVSTGKIVGTEGLIRWQRPDMSLVLPDRFIPLAEANGLIEPIGSWVMLEALRQGKIWHDMGHRLYIGINLSARQFRHKDFERTLVALIDESGFNPSFIELELTESVLAENEEKIVNIMKGLHERGVRFVLDDFSTGYSSLRYIKQFPVDMLKIERNFLKGIPLDVQNSAITKSIITLGQTLGMEVTAEGVESKTQLSFLRDNYCNRAQGYLFNGAMPAHSLTEILGEDRYVSVLANLGKPPLF